MRHKRKTDYKLANEFPSLTKGKRRVVVGITLSALNMDMKPKLQHPSFKHEVTSSVQWNRKIERTWIIDDIIKLLPNQKLSTSIHPAI